MSDPIRLNPVGPLPPRGRLLGIDYGTVRLGIAISDPDRVIASPLQTYTVRNPTVDAVALRTLASSEGAVGIVVGLPLHTGGEEGQKAGEARTFGLWLGSVTGLPVVFWDERFTTALADDAFREAKLSHKKRKDRRDRVAAVLILQGFLDAGCPAAGTVIEPDQPSD